MPIGFWAISRTELRTILQAHSGVNPSNSYLDTIVKEIAYELDYKLDELIPKYANELIRDTDN